MLYHLIFSLLLIFSLPLNNPHINNNLSINSKNLPLNNQFNNNNNNFKTIQSSELAEVMDNTSNFINNSNNFNNESESKTKELNNASLINIELNLGKSTHTAGNSIENSSESTELPPIETLFDQDTWNEAKNQFNTPLDVNNSSNFQLSNQQLKLPEISKLPLSPISNSNLLDLSIQIKKLTLPGVSSLLTPIQPFFNALDKSSQIILSQISELTNNLPLIGPIINTLKLDGILNLPGYLQLRNILDNLILAGDYYSYKN